MAIMISRSFCALLVSACLSSAVLARGWPEHDGPQSHWPLELLFVALIVWIILQHLGR
jgi:hypothetical protein